MNTSSILSLTPEFLFHDCNALFKHWIPTLDDKFLIGE